MEILAEDQLALAQRLLALSDTALGTIFVVVGKFAMSDVGSILAADVRVHGVESGHLPILIEEADQEELQRWLAFFESFP